MSQQPVCTVILQPAGMEAQVNPGDPGPTGVHRSLAFVGTEPELCFHSGALVHPKYQSSLFMPSTQDTEYPKHFQTGLLRDCNNT